MLTVSREQLEGDVGVDKTDRQTERERGGGEREGVGERQRESITILMRYFTSLHKYCNYNLFIVVFYFVIRSSKPIIRSLALSVHKWLSRLNRSTFSRAPSTRKRFSARTHSMPIKYSRAVERSSYKEVGFLLLLFLPYPPPPPPHAFRGKQLWLRKSNKFVYFNMALETVSRMFQRFYLFCFLFEIAFSLLTFFWRVLGALVISD